MRILIVGKLVAWTIVGFVTKRLSLNLDPAVNFLKLETSTVTKSEPVTVPEILPRMIWHLRPPL